MQSVQAAFVGQRATPLVGDATRAVSEVLFESQILREKKRTNVAHTPGNRKLEMSSGVFFS